MVDTQHLLRQVGVRHHDRFRGRAWRGEPENVAVLTLQIDEQLQRAGQQRQIDFDSGVRRQDRRFRRAGGRHCRSGVETYIVGRGLGGEMRVSSDKQGPADCLDRRGS